MRWSNGRFARQPGGDETVSQAQAQEKSGTRRLLQPRSGNTGKRGTSVPGSKSGTKSSPGGTAYRLRHRFGDARFSTAEPVLPQWLPQI